MYMKNVCAHCMCVDLHKEMRSHAEWHRLAARIRSLAIAVIVWTMISTMMPCHAMPKICMDLYTIEMSLFVAVDRTTQHQLQRAS